MNHTKTILVTGAAGTIGSHLTDIMLNAGYNVDGIDDLSYGTMDNLKLALENSNFTFIKSKVEDMYRNETRFKTYDAIFHFASLKKVWDGSVASTEVMDTNFNMTKAVISKAARNGSKIIFASTSDIYGNSKTFKEDDDITMGAPTNERYSYALSKWHSEQYILNYIKEQNTNAAIVRIFGCASARSNKYWSGGHIPYFVTLALNNEDINIHGDGLQTRSISHSLDIAQGFKQVYDNFDKVAGTITNLGTNQQTTVKYVAEYIINKTNSNSKINYIPIKEVFGDYKEILVRFANTEKAEKLLNYIRKYNTEQVINDIIEGFSK
jgi:UDP-glucose 4-epimerase